MAGAYLTIGAKFRPFSYEELIRPVAASAQMHAQIDEKLGELQEKAGIWENLANRETERESYTKYKEYADALRAQAEDLAKNGLNSQSFRNLMNMRARYSTDIVPLEQAYTRRRQLADEQRKLYQANPTLKFQRDMATVSLDDMVKNPELDYGYSVNGALVAQQAGQAFAHLAKTIQQEPQYSHILNGYYWQSMTKAGYSPDQILALSVNDENAPKELKAIAQQVYDSTGVEDFINKNYQDPTSAGAQEWRDYVNSYINQGAWNAVGTTAYGTVADPQKQYENQLEALRIKAGLSGSKKGSSGAASTGAASTAIDRNDSRLIGKASTDNKHYLGTRNIADDTRASKLIEQKIMSLYNNKSVDTVEGFDENGAISKGTIKKSDLVAAFTDGKAQISDLQIDYNSGDMIAHILIYDGKKSKDVSVLLPYNTVLNTRGASAVADSVAKLQQIDIAKQRGESELLTAAQDENGRWIISDGEGAWYEETFKEYLKNIMFNSMTGLLNYTGALNLNADSGQKLNTSRDATAVALPEDDINVIYEDEE